MSADYLMLTRRGEHAEREACRLIGAAVDTNEVIRKDTREALAAIDPEWLDDIGGRAQLCIELLRKHPEALTPVELVECAMRDGLDACAIGLGSFLSECNLSPSFQPLDAVASIRNFSEYCGQLRAVERLSIQAWQGKRLPELGTT